MQPRIRTATRALVDVRSKPFCYLPTSLTSTTEGLQEHASAPINPQAKRSTTRPVGDRRQHPFARRLAGNWPRAGSPGVPTRSKPLPPSSHEARLNTAGHKLPPSDWRKVARNLRCCAAPYRLRRHAHGRKYAAAELRHVRISNCEHGDRCNCWACFRPVVPGGTVRVQQ